MKKASSRVKDFSGFSITGAVVGFGLAGVLAMIFALMQSDQARQIQGIRLLMTRDHIRQLANKYTAEGSAIQTSLDATRFTQATSQGNQLLNVCLNGNG